MDRGSNEMKKKAGANRTALFLTAAFVAALMITAAFITFSQTDDDDNEQTLGAEFGDNGIIYNILTADTAEVSSYYGTGTSVTIPATVSNGGKTYTVTAVGGKAFSGLNGSGGKSTLNKVVLPETVKALGDYAFSDCWSLSDINLEYVEKIGEYALRHCDPLKKIDLRSATDIADCAFQQCSGLNEMTVSSALKSIGPDSFQLCSITPLIPYSLSNKTINIKAVYFDGPTVATLKTGSSDVTFTINDTADTQVISVGTAYKGNDVLNSVSGTSWTFSKPSGKDLFVTAVLMHTVTVDITNGSNDNYIEYELSGSGIWTELSGNELTVPDGDQITFRVAMQPDHMFMWTQVRGNLSDDGIISMTVDEDISICGIFFGADDLSVTFDGSLYTYDGSEIRPSISADHEGYVFTENTEYILDYLNNVNAGTASVIITGMSALIGSKTVQFEIEKAEGSGSVTIDDRIFGEAPGQCVITNPNGADITIYYKLQAGGDWSTELPVSAGDHLIKVIFSETENYYEYISEEYPFSIFAKNIDQNYLGNSLNVEDIPDNTYTGSEIRPEPRVNCNGIELNAGTDLDYGYEDNVNAGTAKITITFTGNYSGSVTVTFEIVCSELTQEDLENGDIEVEEISSQTYTGSEIMPEPSVKYLGEIIAAEYEYEDNINVGVAKVTITFTGNYSGSVTVEFQIASSELTQEDIENGNVEIEETAPRTYTGSDITPEPPVKYNGEAIEAEYTYEDNLNVGTAKIIITFTGNYSGSVTVTFEIVCSELTQEDLENGDIEVEEILSQTYTGSEIMPEPSVKYLGEVIEAEYAYEDNINVGVAKVTITFTGNYSGSAAVTFEIIANELTQDDLENGDLEIQDVPSQKCTGSDITPEPQVKYNGEVIEAGYAYEDNVSVGTAKIVITFTGNYSGSVTVEFQIVNDELTQEDIESGDLTVESVDPQVYTGSEIKPEPRAKYLGEMITVQYEYEDNVNAGTAKIVMTFTGNYAGSVTVTFEIISNELTQDDLENGDIEVEEIMPQTYSGSDITPEPQVKYLGETLTVEYTYEDNVNAGTAKMIIAFAGNYSGSVAVEFQIISSELTTGDLESGDIEVEEITPQTYTGSEIEPEPQVKYLGETLTVEYAYEDNVNVGTAKVIITFTGNYSGSVTVMFEIACNELTQDDIENGSLEIEEIMPQTYSGSDITPEPQVKYLGEILVAEYAYEDNINVGTAKMIITFTENYSGSVVIEFQIVSSELTQDDIDNGNLEIEDVNPLVYSGSEIRPEPQVKYLGETLTVEYAYEDNVNVGTAKVIITFTGNYSGSVAVEFQIISSELTQDDIENGSLEIEEIAPQIYTGSEIRPEPQVKYLGEMMAAGYAYEDNINAGTAKVIITFTGNYSGSVTVTFEILGSAGQISIGDIAVDRIPDQKYTGQEIEPAPGVTYGGVHLTAGTDLRYEYKDNTDIGTGKVIIVFIGNYSGSVTIEFRIIEDTGSDVNPSDGGAGHGPLGSLELWMVIVIALLTGCAALAVIIGINRQDDDWEEDL